MVALVVVAATLGRRLARGTKREKLEVLSRFDGRDVVLWLSFGGRVQGIVPRKGRLSVGDNGSSVVLAGEKDRLVFLEQIRWIEDPTTGTRYGDRW